VSPAKDKEMNYERIKVEPLAPTIGGEISGVDLAEPLDRSLYAEIHAALLDRKVIFFRDQDITEQQHMAFARNFGELEVHPFATPSHIPEMMVIAHGEKSRGRENTWHSDVTFRLRPAMGSVLRGVEMPAVGGDTLFADMNAAYEGLSASMQRMLGELTAIHDFQRTFSRGLSPEKLHEMRREHPPAEHPVIRTHPETGLKSVYVNRLFTSHIVGMNRDESTRLLEFLYSLAGIPEYQIRFKWRNNSIAFWDNRAVQHYAVSDYYPQRRVVNRFTIIGDKPV